MEKKKPKNNAKAALKWITDILKKYQIPFQIAGGLAARAYGATRPLDDIDIDLPEPCFESIFAEISPYTTFGPARYKSELWDLYLLTLNYKGQPIDLSGANTVKIFNKVTGKWQKIPADFSKVETKKVLGLKVPIIPLTELIKYKTVLNREVDRIDVQQIKLNMRINQSK